MGQMGKSSDLLFSTSMLFSCFLNSEIALVLHTDDTYIKHPEQTMLCLFVFEHSRHALKSALTLELKSVGGENKTHIEKIDFFVRIALLCRGVNSILLRTAITLSLFRVN